MEYFVSADLHPYYCWQLELLIQSFKENNCEDSLAIALSKLNGVPESGGYNLHLHERIYGYENIGEIRGCASLNEMYTLSWALQYGQIKQPFVHMQPDMVLRHQPAISFSDYPEFVFYPNPFFSFENIEKEIGPFWEWLGKDKSFYAQKWVPIGSLFISSLLPIEFYDVVAKRAEFLAVQQILVEKPISHHTSNLALATALSDYMDNIFCRGDYTLVSTILEGTNTPFISYEKGIPPDFHKSMFSYPPPAYVSFGDPIKTLSEIFPSPNAHYVAVLASKNLQSRNKGLE